MSEQPKPKRSKEELLKWFEERQKNPLFVDSEEFEGMSISYANPELVPEEDEEECAAETTLEREAEQKKLADLRREIALAMKDGEEANLALLNAQETLAGERKNRETQP